MKMKTKYVFLTMNHSITTHDYTDTTIKSKVYQGITQ